MARQQSVAVFNNFNKGINTEASPINYVPDCTLDEENFDLRRTGGRNRRLGIDFEDDYSLIDVEYTELYSYTISSWRWDNINNDSDLIFFCVQIGAKLWFLDATKVPHSDNVVGTLTLPGFSGTKVISYAAVNGQLVITTGETPPLLITYNKATSTFSYSIITIKVRDIWGVDDGLEVTYHPPVLLNDHHYNLFNQGWYYHAATDDGTPDPDKQINIINDSSLFQGYPNNAEVWWVSKSLEDPDRVRPRGLAGTQFGNTPAPKGYFIIDAFNRGASRRVAYTGFYDLPADTETGKLSCVTSMGNRIFYSGVKSNVVGGDDKSPNYNGVVFFSKIIENEEDYEKCHQESDPTAENYSDLIDTDGGHVIITSAQGINHLAVLGTSVFIFAENGVWELSGDTGSGFKATGYKVNQITNVGCINPNSVVVVEDTIFYWAKGGIFQIIKGEVTGEYQANNISQFTIKTLYDEIPYLSKLNAKGIYDSFDKKLRWLYLRSDTIKDCDCPVFTGELIYDTILQAFYKNRFTEKPPDEEENIYPQAYVVGHLVAPYYSTETIDDYVVAGNDFVYEDTDWADRVSAPGRKISNTTLISHKYLVLDVIEPNIESPGEYTLAFTVAWLKNPNFIDWEAVDAIGMDYSSYILTGYLNQSEVLTKKQTPYAFFFFEQTEKDLSALDYDNPSSCKVRARWDWSNSSNSNQWGSEFQAYRLVKPHLGSLVAGSFDYGYDVVVTKNKLRGNGKALSLYLSSESGKDCRILGWGMQLSVNSIP